MDSYFAYIIYSAILDRYYIGSTSDIAGRLRRHNSSHKGFTAMSQDWSVVYSEMFETKSDAIRREREIKSWKSRVLIERLIASKP